MKRSRRRRKSIERRRTGLLKLYYIDENKFHKIQCETIFNLIINLNYLGLW